MYQQAVTLILLQETNVPEAMWFYDRV